MSDLGIRTTKSYLNENQTWIHAATQASGLIRDTRGVTLDTSKFSRVTFPNGLIPSGLALAKITASGLYAPYADATEVATPGTGVMVGFLFATVEWDPAAPSTLKLPVALLERGTIIEANLPTSHGVDANGKTDVGNRFIFV